MSTRMANLEGHRNLLALQQAGLDWKRKTSVNREVPKGDRTLLRAEVWAATNQLKKLVAIVPDAQAAAIAAWFGSTIESVQRGLVVFTSCVGQLIKVACIFFGFALLTHGNSRVAADVAGGNFPNNGNCSGNSSGAGNSETRQPTKVASLAGLPITFDPSMHAGASPVIRPSRT
jgi:hypothetical protein